MSLVTTYSFSQSQIPFKTTSSLVNRFPVETDGFLVLNQYGNPEVARWEVTFLKPSFTENVGITSFSTDRIVDIRNSYFTNLVDLPESSFGYGFINITGYSAGNNVIVTDGPIGYTCVGCVDETYCSPGCNGDTYAYSLDVFGPAGAGYGFLVFNSAHRPGNAPFYQYFSTGDWNTFEYGQTEYIRDHYMFPYNQTFVITSQGSYDPANHDRLIKINASSIPTNVVYKDKNGTPISGDIRGIRKAQGDWNHYNNMDISATNPITFCNGGYNQAVLAINAQKSNWQWETSAAWSTESSFFSVAPISTRPSLGCNGTSWTVYGQANNQGTAAAGAAGATKPCKWSWIKVTNDTVFVGYVNGVPNYTVSTTYNWTPCSGTAQQNPNNPWIDWPTLAESVTFTPKDPNNFTGPIIINASENSIKYEISGENVNLAELENGLYHALFQFPDQSIHSTYVLFEDDDQTNDFLSNHLTAFVSPVPVPNNEFVLNLESDIALDFQFKLISLTSEILIDRSFQISEQETLKEYLTIDEYNTPGMLICQFIFSDGSVKSFSITKL